MAIYPGTRLILGALFAVSTLARAKHVSIPVRRHESEGAAVEHAVRSISKFTARSSAGFAAEPFYYGPGSFWYGIFDVGESKNLSLIMDTASSTMYLKSGRYKPSNKSVNYHKEVPNDPAYGFSTVCKADNRPITSHIFSDTVTMGLEIVAQNLSFGVMGSIKNTGFPLHSQDGIMGLSIGLDFENHGDGWVDKLCHEGQLNECRFGTALGTQGTHGKSALLKWKSCALIPHLHNLGEGAFILGGVAEDLFEGPLTPIASSSGSGEAVFNVVIDGSTTLLKKRLAGLFDTGTNDIVMPASDARAIFDALGMETVEQTYTQVICTESFTGYLSQVVGNYPCDNPPTLGLQILSTSSNASIGPIFNIEPEAFKLSDNGNNSCTSVVIGTTQVEGYWDVGQAWMQGKYLDWNYDGVASGVATLKDKATPSNISSDSTSSSSAANNLRPLGLVLMVGLVAVSSSLC